MTLERLDEINNIIDVCTELYSSKAIEPEQVADDFVEFLMFVYNYGYEEYGGKSQPSQYEIAQKSAFKEIKGKTAVERLLLALAGENVEMEIRRILDTEFHRMYNNGVYDFGSSKQFKKKWATMGDEKVRETHFYLMGMVKPMKEPFYTIDGDHAQYPGDFELAENNVNCRCWLELVK